MNPRKLSFVLLFFPEVLKNNISMEEPTKNDYKISAKIHFDEKNYKKCIEDCEAFLLVEENQEIRTLLKKANINLLITQAKGCFHFQNYQKCINECYKILKIKEIVEVRTLLQSAKLEQKNKKEIDELMEKAQAYFKNKKFKECIKICEQILIIKKISAASNLIKKAEYQIENYSKNLLRDSLKTAKHHFDTAKYKLCIEDCETVLQVEENIVFRNMLKESMEALKYEEETDLYLILGVQKGANTKIIKEGYFFMSKKYHPDKHSNSTKEMKVYCENLYKKITNAYRALTEK